MYDIRSYLEANSATLDWCKLSASAQLPDVYVVIGHLTGNAATRGPHLGSVAVSRDPPASMPWREEDISALSWRRGGGLPALSRTRCRLRAFLRPRDDCLPSLRLWYHSTGSVAVARRPPYTVGDRRRSPGLVVVLARRLDIAATSGRPLGRLSRPRDTLLASPWRLGISPHCRAPRRSFSLIAATHVCR